MMLSELERVEEVDENEEDGKGETHEEGKGGLRACEEGGAEMKMSPRSVCKGR